MLFKYLQIHGRKRLVSIMEKIKCILIDPPYEAFDNNLFFDGANALLNRDGTLEPFIRLKKLFESRGFDVYTADIFLKNPEDFIRRYVSIDYYSFGRIRNFYNLLSYKKINLAAFILQEPPLISPNLYRKLPLIIKCFNKVYLHNVRGDGYRKSKTYKNIFKFLNPIPYENIIKKYWEADKRLDKICVINSNHNPILFCIKACSFRYLRRELYSTRINALIALNRLGLVDLYGRRWAEWWSPYAMWLPYIRNMRVLQKIYKGPCASKYEILKNYKFALCFENMQMSGYITEKIFDCFYAGTIPIYLGPSDMSEYVPSDTYIDASKYRNWDDLAAFVMQLRPHEVEEYRLRAKEFLGGDPSKIFFNSLENIIN